MPDPAHHTTTSQTTRIVASWLVVGIPLAWGVAQTVQAAIKLFGG